MTAHPQFGEAEKQGTAVDQARSKIYLSHQKKPTKKEIMNLSVHYILNIFTAVLSNSSVRQGTEAVIYHSSQLPDC